MINDALSVSPSALDLLKEIERLSLTPYNDQTGEPITEWCKGATIGFGHLVAEHDWPKFKKGVDIGRAVDLLEDDLQPAIYAVHKAIIVPLKQNQFDALVLLAFNIGAPQFRQSSAVRMINDPRAVTPYVGLESAWKAFNKSQGKYNDGLDNRRACEWRIFSKGIYSGW